MLGFYMELINISGIIIENIMAGVEIYNDRYYNSCKRFKIRRQ